MNKCKIVILLILLFFVSACENYNSRENYNIEYIKPMYLPDESKLIFHGMIKSQLISNLSFQTEGKITYLPFSKGDFVKKGQVLARLDNTLYKIQKDEQKANLENAVIQYNKSKNYFKRMDILHKEGGISDNDWEQAYFEYKTNEQQIKIQKEKLNYFNKELSYNEIVAPYDGYIASKVAEVGSYAKIGDVILVINGTNKTQAEIMVDSSYVNDLKINDQVSVIYNNSKFQGHISHISNTSINSGGYLVKINLDSVYPNLKDGMSVDVELNSLKSGILYLPLSAVDSEGEEKYVYKILQTKDNAAQVVKTKVETGEIINEKIQIINGVGENDLVVSKNLNTLRGKNKIKL